MFKIRLTTISPIALAITIIMLILFCPFAIPATQASAPDTVALSADEQTMLSLLNEQRRINGLSTLKIDPKLEAMARQYCREMITNRFFSHTSPVSGGLLNRIMDSEIPDGWLLAGENLAGAPTVEAAFKGLMESPSHKENMLEPKYTHVGIAVIDGGPYGKMFVQEFIEYPEGILGKVANGSKSNLTAFLSANLSYPGYQFWQIHK